MNNTQSVTRGFGLLERFLAEKRAQKANGFIKENLRKGNILDIGCGSYPYFLISTKFKNKFGIDPSLNVTEVKGLNLKKLDVTSKKLPYADNFFNVVTMLAVFEHLEINKLSFVLDEVRRVLKAGGIFIITTPSPWTDKLLHQMANFGLISSEEIHDHKHHYGKKAIEDILIYAGFNPKKLKSGYFEFGFNMWFFLGV